MDFVLWNIKKWYLINCKIFDKNFMMKMDYKLIIVFALEFENWDFNFRLALRNSKSLVAIMEKNAHESPAAKSPAKWNHFDSIHEFIISFY
jgi:hypothetical protein